MTAEDLFAGGRSVGVAHALVDAALDHALELERRGGRREVERSMPLVLRLVLLQVRVDHHRLGRALLANQHHRLTDGQQRQNNLVLVNEDDEMRFQ